MGPIVQTSEMVSAAMIVNCQEQPTIHGLQFTQPIICRLLKNRFHLSAFLVGYMDDPLFDATYPKYVNIALTGNILAHETSHGFDTAGIKRDENGEVRSWMKPEDLKEYGKKTQCLVDQYNEYDDPVFGKNVSLR